MEPVLVDTDVVSYAFKHDTRGLSFAPLLLGRSTTVSFMTVAELRRWAISRNWGTARRESLNAFMARFSVFPCDDALCTAWAEVMDGSRRKGRPIQTANAWIAATAIRYGLTLVTNNPGDYAGVSDLRILTA